MFSPAVAGGWTSQLPRLVAPERLPRASAIDAMTFSAASLAGPGLAAVAAAWLGARTAVLIAAILIALAVPAALTLAFQTMPMAPTARRNPDPMAPTARQAPARWRHWHAGDGGEVGLGRQVVAGLLAIWRRPALRRATVTSAVSYVGIGMLLVCCPLLGRERLGTAAHGALLISAMAAASLTANAALARRAGQTARRSADSRVLISTLVIGVGMAAAVLTPGWFTALAVAAGGAGEGPQLSALFEVRHREAPASMRAQIFTTAASLKIGGMSLGAALAGPLAGRSVVACLLAAAGVEACAAAAYLATGPRSAPQVMPMAPTGPRSAC